VENLQDDQSEWGKNGSPAHDGRDNSRVGGSGVAEFADIINGWAGALVPLARRAP
jgi:hypothetical protein